MSEIERNSVQNDALDVYMQHILKIFKEDKP